MQVCMDVAFPMAPQAVTGEARWCDERDSFTTTADAGAVSPSLDEAREWKRKPSTSVQCLTWPGIPTGATTR